MFGNDSIQSETGCTFPELKQTKANHKHKQTPSYAIPTRMLSIRSPYQIHMLPFITAH